MLIFIRKCSRKEKVKDEQDQEDDDPPEKEWGPPDRDKVTMRAYYKTIRFHLSIIPA